MAVTSCANSYNIQGTSNVSTLDGRMLYLKVLKNNEAIVRSIIYKLTIYSIQFPNIEFIVVYKTFLSFQVIEINLLIYIKLYRSTIL